MYAEDRPMLGAPIHGDAHSTTTRSSDSSQARPLTPPYLTPMSSYQHAYPTSQADADVSSAGGEAGSVTSLPLGPLITADGRGQAGNFNQDGMEEQKPMNGQFYGPEQGSPSRFYEPFPEGPIPAEQFRPRREFIPSIHAPCEFALLTLTEGNLVRMLGFDDQAVAAVRSVLTAKQGGIVPERRGKELPPRRKSTDSNRSNGGRTSASPTSGATTPEEGDLVEWSLDGKPWKERKLSSEVLITLLISTLISLSYKYVSPLHIPGTSSPVQFSGIFSRPLEPSPERRAAFSITFPASNIVRVLGAPKEGTPGILAVVRQAWGRRLKDERIEDSVWEGRLKGPGLFGQVPEPPGPEVVLETLAALNRQGIELLTIIKLAGTEMWLFECPAGVENTTPLTPPTLPPIAHSQA